MSKQSDNNNPQGSHKFSNVPGFDQAMKKIVEVPKEVVEQREQASHTPRTAKPDRPK